MTYIVTPQARPARHTTRRKSVFRPTWRARLLIPVVMLVLLAGIELTNTHISLTAAQSFAGKALLGVILFLALYQWIMLMFVCRVCVEGNMITSYGNTLFPQTRDLRDLVDVETLEKKGLLKLTFNNARPIYTMLYISQPNTFFAALGRHIARNT